MLTITFDPTLTPAQNGTALAVAVRDLTPEARVRVARALAVTPPTDTNDLTLRTIGALLVQGGPSVVGSPAHYNSTGQSWCRYRGGDGRACAVGVWIPDGRYKTGMDTGSWGLGEVLDKAGLAWAEDAEMFRALRNMQCIHDEAAFTMRDKGMAWPAALLREAQEFAGAWSHTAHIPPALEMIEAFIAADAA